MLLIYSNNSSLRFDYIIEALFSSVVEIEYAITTNIDEYMSYAGAKINYSTTPVTSNEVWVEPHTLLFENNIQPQALECFMWNGLTVFFKTNGDIPFDIFAASFYLITRYEEYLPHAKDEYGRYAHANSLAFKEGFLHLPLVNLWMKELKDIITSKFPGFYYTLRLSPSYPLTILTSPTLTKAKAHCATWAAFIKTCLPAS